MSCKTLSIAVLTVILMPMAAHSQIDPYAGELAEQKTAYQHKADIEDDARALGRAAACRAIELDVAAASVDQTLIKFLRSQDNFARGAPVFNVNIIDRIRQLVFDEAKKPQECLYWYKHPEVALARAAAPSVGCGIGGRGSSSSNSSGGGNSGDGGSGRGGSGTSGRGGGSGSVGIGGGGSGSVGIGGGGGGSVGIGGGGGDGGGGSGSSGGGRDGGGGSGGGVGSNVSAPGPIAGAGLGYLALAGGYYVVRRWRKHDNGE
ncbi:MAG: hypothetical protein ACREC9_06640 [Methylocella sp.]